MLTLSRLKRSVLINSRPTAGRHNFVLFFFIIFIFLGPNNFQLEICK